MLECVYLRCTQSLDKWLLFTLFLILLCVHSFLFSSTRFYVALYRRTNGTWNIIYYTRVILFFCFRSFVMPHYPLDILCKTEQIEMQWFSFSFLLLLLLFTEWNKIEEITFLNEYQIGKNAVSLITFYSHYFHATWTMSYASNALCFTLSRSLSLSLCVSVPCAVHPLFE